MARPDPWRTPGTARSPCSRRWSGRSSRRCTSAACWRSTPARPRGPGRDRRRRAERPRQVDPDPRARPTRSRAAVRRAGRARSRGRAGPSLPRASTSGRRRSACSPSSRSRKPARHELGGGIEWTVARRRSRTCSAAGWASRAAVRGPPPGRSAGRRRPASNPRGDPGRGGPRAPPEDLGGIGRLRRDPRVGAMLAEIPCVRLAVGGFDPTVAPVARLGTPWLSRPQTPRRWPCSACTGRIETGKTPGSRPAGSACAPGRAGRPNAGRVRDATVPGRRDRRVRSAGPSSPTGWSAGASATVRAAHRQGRQRGLLRSADRPVRRPRHRPRPKSAETASLVQRGVGGRSARVIARVSRWTGRGARVAHRFAVHTPDPIRGAALRAIPSLARVSTRLIVAPITQEHGAGRR